MKRTLTFLFLMYIQILHGIVWHPDSYEFPMPAEENEIPHKITLSFLKTVVTIGGFTQLQKNWFLDSPVPQGQHAVRRLRLYVTSKSRDILGLMFMVQGDKDRWNYHYIYADILKPEFFMLRIGLFKKPFSLEALYSSRYLWMVNRSLGAINYQNLLDIGIGAHGSFLKDSVEYGIGLFNGNGRNLENNPHKLVCGRIVWRPWITRDDSPFRKLQFGASFSTSQKLSTPSSFATGSGTTFLSWNSSKTRAKTQKSLAGADIEWLNGPAALRGEFLIVDWGKVTNQNQSAPFTGYSWYVEGNYLLTGETQPRNHPLFPDQKFTICHGGGAFEIAARYEAFQADHKVVEAGLATGTTYVSSFTLGANYYFNPFILTRFDWQLSNFHKRITVKNHTTRYESVLTWSWQGEF